MKRIYLQKVKTQVARPNKIRDINKQIVLTYVRDLAPISRADIARETDLQRSTVSSIVDELQLDGLIEEIGTGDSNGGRKPTLLKLKTGIPVAIGVDITPRVTTIALADLAGRILQKNSFPTSPDADYMSGQIIDKIKEIVSKNQKQQLEVGISIPGIADQTTGRIRYVPYFHWSNWNLAEQITKQTNLRVTIDNDANAIALAETWFGDEISRRDRNFITVLVAEGIGTGVIFDGQVYRGDKGAAGEFGHMIIGENGPVLCSCGSRNCWEAYASEKAAIFRFQNLVEDSSFNSDEIDMELLTELANTGDKNALFALKETAKYIGIGISNLLIGFSPQAVIVSGSIVKAWSLIVDEIECLAERSVLQGLPHAVIRASSLGDSPTVLGSLSLVLAKKFASAN